MIFQQFSALHEYWLTECPFQFLFYHIDTNIRICSRSICSSVTILIEFCWSYSCLLWNPFHAINNIVYFVLQYVGSVRVVAFQHNERLNLIKQHMEQYRVSLCFLITFPLFYINLLFPPSTLFALILLIYLTVWDCLTVN